MEECRLEKIIDKKNTKKNVEKIKKYFISLFNHKVKVYLRIIDPKVINISVYCNIRDGDIEILKNIYGDDVKVFYDINRIEYINIACDRMNDIYVTIYQVNKEADEALIIRHNNEYQKELDNYNRNVKV